MRGMAREYAAGNSCGPGWRKLVGTFGQSPAGFRPGVEWLAAGPWRDAHYPRKRQGEVARRAGEPSHQSEDPPREGLGGHHLLVQTDARRPAGQVWAITWNGQPGGVGGEAARRHVIQTDAVLEVSDGILDLGVAAMVGIQFQGFPVPVGDEAVIAVGGEEGQLGTGRGFHPPDDEPYRRGVGLALEGGVGGLRHIGGAVHPLGKGVQSSSGIASIRSRRLVCWRKVMERADIHFPADGNDSVDVEAAVGPYRELSSGPAVAHPPPPSHAGSWRRHGRCWPRPSVDKTSARHRCWRRPRAAGDTTVRRCSRGGARPPWPVHTSRRWSSPGHRKRPLQVVGVLPIPFHLEGPAIPYFPMRFFQHLG